MSGRQQLAGRAGAVVLTVVIGLGVAGSAQAAGLSPARAEAVADGLGARAAGTYFDRSRDAMVVAVTDQAAAERVRAIGGAARVAQPVRAPGPQLAVVHARRAGAGSLRGRGRGG